MDQDINVKNIITCLVLLTCSASAQFVPTETAAFYDLSTIGIGQWNYYDNTGNQQFGLWLDGGGTTSRGVLINTPGVTGANSVTDNWIGLRFGGASNKMLFGDNGSITQMSSFHTMYFSANAGQSGVGSYIPDITILRSNGKVGLKTITPGASLHVVGNFMVGGGSSLLTCTNSTACFVEPGTNTVVYFGTDNNGNPSSSTLVNFAAGSSQGTTPIFTIPNAVLPGIYAKVTGAATAPTAGNCTMRFEAGTNTGTGKLVAYCGTSTTGVTIADNIGAGF